LAVVILQIRLRVSAIGSILTTILVSEVLPSESVMTSLPAQAPCHSAGSGEIGLPSLTKTETHRARRKYIARMNCFRRGQMTTPVERLVSRLTPGGTERIHASRVAWQPESTTIPDCLRPNGTYIMTATTTSTATTGFFLAVDLGKFKSVACADNRAALAAPRFDRW
jgi:hypothetical protein